MCDIQQLTSITLVILYYDHAITFDDEYWLVWRTPNSGASVFFLVNRYFSFFSNITITAGNFSSFKSVQSCAHYTFYRQLSLIATQIIVAVIQFLRTYALYGRDRRFAVVVVSVATVLAALSIWAVIDEKSTYTVAQGCHAASSRISAIHLAVAWEALFVWDMIIFFLTFFKSVKNRDQYGGRSGSLASLIFRDGAIYFGCVFVPGWSQAQFLRNSRVMACAQCSNTLTFYVCTLTPYTSMILSRLFSS
ncbi:uncharacterized protein PHACADRAFT_188242, partial [Phanerochaete carnosa HHB-10118-sp]